MSVTILRGGLLITPQGALWGDLAIRGRTILQIAPKISASHDDNVLDISGCIVFPGFIDAHTHLDMASGGVHTADDFESGTRAALMGGTTTVIDFASQERGGSLRSALDVWHDLADGKSSCNYAFHMAVTDWNSTVRQELPHMIKNGITGFKAYMTYDHLMLPDPAIRELLAALKPLGGILGVHCEDHAILRAKRSEILMQGTTSPAGHPLSRPPEAEANAIARLCTVAQELDAPVHIVHLSSALALEEIRKARRRGQRVFAETCPQYLLLDESAYDRTDGANYIMSPPLRNRTDTEVLCQAVVDGEIDSISTDHCSFYQHDKSGHRCFSDVPNGIPGAEHRVSLMLSAFHGQLSYTRLAQLMSENAAKLFHLYPQKGVLQVGSDADITIWDPDPVWTICAQDQHSNADFTPWEGMKVKGMVRHVFLNGIHAVQNGLLAIPLTGEFVKEKIN